MASKKSNTGLRMMMATASLVGFLGGWVMLGHAPKPSLPVQSSTSINTSTSSGGLFQLPSGSVSTSPRLRTGGS